jgi:GNAT superfamily N-acetyltransferase
MMKGLSITRLKLIMLIFIQKRTIETAGFLTISTIAKYMEINIRRATENDFPGILALIRKLAEFEKAPEKVTNSVEQMEKEKEYFRCFVAEEEGGTIIGIALYFFAYYTWVGKSLYLDDIYVNEEYRKMGVGTALLEKIFEEAIREDCKRVRWQVLSWNRPAIEMYRKNGAEIDDEWLNCSFDHKGILNFGRKKTRM